MSSDNSDTSDTDEIPVAQRTEVEHKPRMARTIRVLALPIVVFWLLIAVGVNVFVPQLEKVAEDVSVPLSPSDAPSVTGSSGPNASPRAASDPGPDIIATNSRHGASVASSSASS